MGTFSVTIDLRPIGGERGETMEALVDTGSTYTFVPRQVLERLGIAQTGKRPFRLANEQRVIYDVGWAEIRVDGSEGVTLVVFGEPDVMPLLGAHALESLGMAADPVTTRLVLVDALLK